MITFSFMVTSRHFRIFSGLAAASAVLFSACQTTGSGDDAAARELSYELNARVGCVPDSVTWNLAGQSGTGKAVPKPGSTNVAIISFSFPMAPGSETITADYWTLSVHTATETIKDGAHTITWKDELGLTLLIRLDSLHKSADSARYPLNASSVVQIYAKALVDHDTTFKGFPSQRVASIDTLAVYNAALIYAASKHIPISIQSKSWLLGLDSTTANKLVAKLMGPKGPISKTDSLSLFPPYPVRVATPLSVAPLNVGGPAIAVSGSFVGDSGLSAYKVRILQEKLDVSNLFNIATQPTQLDGSQTTWSLASDARLTLQVNTAQIGSYILEVSAFDKKGRTDTGRVQFSVLPPPDRTGPNITWISPSSNLLLEYKDSVILAKIKATDASGVDSVWIDGKPATRTDSTWSFSVTIPVSDLGYELKVRARDSVGNSTDSLLRIIRQKEPAPGAPIVQLVSPSSRNGNRLPFDSVYLRLSWIIKDIVGIDTTSVTISGAKNIQHHDSTWLADVAIPPSGQSVTITLGVKNTKGISASDFVNVVRAKDTIKPVISITSHADTVDFDSTSTNFSFGVSDNHKITSVLVGDSLVGTGVKTYTIRSPLALGQNSFLVTVFDSTGNKTQATVNTYRKSDTTKPVIFRVNGTGPKDVKWADSVATVEWIVTDDGNRVEVRINGQLVTISQGKFSSSITFSKLGEQYVKIEAKDRAGNIATDSIRIFRKSPVFTKIFNNGAGVLAALKEDGKLIIWGDTSNGMSNIPSVLHNIKDISIGTTFVLALDQDNNIFGWGNTYGTVMDSVLSYKKAKLIMSGGAFAGIVTMDGQVKVWNAYPDTDGHSPMPSLTDIPKGLKGVTSMVTGGRYILALDSTGKVWGWGDDLFSGPTVPDGLPKIKQVSAGLHSLALSEAGKVYGWGDFFGVEPVPDITGTVIKVSAANTLALALLDDGTMKFWGDGSDALNNYPRGTTRYTDAQVTKSCGIALSEAGDLVVWGICKYPSGI